MRPPRWRRGNRSTRRHSAHRASPTVSSPIRRLRNSRRATRSSPYSAAPMTAHGFRSTFSDWCAETTPFPAEVREMALAHVVSDEVEAAYGRGDLFEKRRALAEAWANATTAHPQEKVVAF